MLNCPPILHLTWPVWPPSPSPPLRPWNSPPPRSSSRGGCTSGSGSSTFSRTCPPQCCSRSLGPCTGDPPSPCLCSRARTWNRLKIEVCIFLENRTNLQWSSWMTSFIASTICIVSMNFKWYFSHLPRCLDCTVCSPTQIRSTLEQPLPVTAPSEHACH